MKKIVQLYKGLLPAFGLTVAENDKIYIGGGELKPITAPVIDGKNIFLPTEEFLKNSEFRDQIAFHPLVENCLKQPSQVLHMLQQALTTHLFISGQMIIKALLAVCAKQKKGESVSSPKLLKFLSGNEEADEKTALFFNNLCAVIENDLSKKIFSVYLKFGGKVNGVEVSRQCSITSPLLEALERAQALSTAKSGPASVWGVEAPRKKDIELLINVIKSAFPLLEEKGYTRGSVNKIAPYCEALFDSTFAINEAIVEATCALAKQEPVCSLANYLLVDVAPLEELLATTSEWDLYRNTIMKTAYNEGEGWNEARTGAVVKEEYKVIREEGVVSQTIDAPADTHAITKTIIANQVKRVPGTRQPLVTLPEEEMTPLVRDGGRRSYGNRYEEKRGYSLDDRDRDGGRFEGRVARKRQDPRDMDDRDLEDLRKELKDEIYDIERNGTREERDSIRGLERELDDVNDELRYRDRNDRPRRDSGRRDDDRRDSGRRYGSQRPIPRAVTDRDGGRRGGRFSNRR